MRSQTNQPSQSQLSETTRRRLEAQIADPNVSDQLNPAFLFSLTSVDLLLAIAGGVLDPVMLAKKELANRGLNADGRWVGFDRAREIWGVK